jgi:hypothetical protein
VAGYLFILKPIPAGARAETSEQRNFLVLVLPILVIIAVYTLVSIFLPEVSRIGKYLPMAIGIVAAIGILQGLRPLPKAAWKRLLLSAKPLSMALLVAAIRIYGAFIEARLPGGGLLMDLMREEMSRFGIPAFALVMIIPFISGLTTGIAVGFIGASFPIIAVLLGEDPSLAQTLSTMAVAYTCGEIGMLLSPMHVCLVVTNEHFQTKLGKSIVSLLKPSVFLLSGALVLGGVLRAIL